MPWFVELFESRLPCLGEQLPGSPRKDSFTGVADTILCGLKWVFSMGM